MKAVSAEQLKKKKKKVTGDQSDMEIDVALKTAEVAAPNTELGSHRLAEKVHEACKTDCK